MCVQILCLLIYIFSSYSTPTGVADSLQNKVKLKSQFCLRFPLHMSNLCTSHQSMCLCVCVCKRECVCVVNLAVWGFHF